jgi:hypothetical protein
VVEDYRWNSNTPYLCKATKKGDALDDLRHGGFVMTDTEEQDHDWKHNGADREVEIKAPPPILLS